MDENNNVMENIPLSYQKKLEEILNESSVEIPRCANCEFLLGMAGTPNLCFRMPPVSQVISRKNPITGIDDNIQVVVRPRIGNPSIEFCGEYTPKENNRGENI